MWKLLLGKPAAYENCQEKEWHLTTELFSRNCSAEFEAGCTLGILLRAVLGGVCIHLWSLEKTLPQSSIHVASVWFGILSVLSFPPLIHCRTSWLWDLGKQFVVVP